MSSNHPNWQTLKQSADRARSAHKHDEAVALYTQALSCQEISERERYELLSAQEESFRRLGDFHSAVGNLEEMRRLAAGEGDLAGQVAALKRQIELLGDLDRVQEAEDLANASLALALESRDPDLEVISRIGKSISYNLTDRFSESIEQCELALSISLRTGNRRGELESMGRGGDAFLKMGLADRGWDYLNRALSLARTLKDRYAQGMILLSAGFHASDQGLKRQYWEEAGAIFQEIGDRSGQAKIDNNLGFEYYNLGLYGQASRYAARAVQSIRDMGFQRDLSLALDTVARVALVYGRIDEANQAIEEGLRLAIQGDFPRMKGLYQILSGQVSLQAGNPEQALAAFQAASRSLKKSTFQGNWAMSLSMQGMAALALNDQAAAERLTGEAVKMIMVESGPLFTDFPQQDIFWLRYQVLTGSDPQEPPAEEAWEVLQNARQAIFRYIASVSDEGMRRNALNKPATNRAVLLEWAREAARRGLPVGEPLPAERSLKGQEPFKRMLDLSLRMNEQRDPVSLLDFILEEVVELCGAERAALYLPVPGERLEFISQGIEESDLPNVQAEAGRLLEELDITRRPILELSEPDQGGSPEAVLRYSRLAIPLLSRGSLIGLIYADNRLIFGRFGPADVDLLSVFANQAATAIENVRWSQTLEQRVEERTVELHESNRSLEQRNAELQIISTIQHGLATELNFQAIIDLVGEELRQIFDSQVVTILTYDRQTGLFHWPYTIEKGQRQTVLPEPPSGFAGHILRTRQPLMINSGMEQRAAELGSTVAAGQFAKSYLGVPLIAGGEVTGVISLQNVDREGAFSEHDLRLLSTLALTMGVALENARLFEQTEHLLEETSQRTAELTIINRVQEGLVRQLDYQAIIDLVGDEIMRVFPPPQGNAYLYSIFIALYDSQTNLIQFPYWVSGTGDRFYQPPIELGPGLTSTIIQSRQPLVLKSWDDAQSHGAVQFDDGLPDEFAQSWLGVPVLIGDRVTGVICLQDPRVDLYTQADVRLLGTLAASLGVALENARLFEETRRLLDETRQNAAELTIINSVSQAMSRKLDVDAIVRTVGDQVRDSFNSEIVNIALYDPDTNLIHLPYTYDRKYVNTPPFPFGEGLTSQVIRSGEALILRSFEEIQGGGAILTANAPGDEQMPQSYLGVPIIAGEKVTGVIDVQSYQECHYDDSHVRLLSTLASSMSVALENARLFAEIQRLLEETRQRSTELTIINRVQEGLVRQLDFQAVIDLVGDEIMSVFPAPKENAVLYSVFIALYDPQTGLIQFPYWVSGTGGRLQQPPVSIGEGLTSIVIQTRQPLVLKSWQEALSLGTIPVDLEPGQAVESWLGVPILTGDQVTGVISIQDPRENLYTESDVRLLSTLAASLGVALENARLFTETQRLLGETEQRNAELAIINTVQAALAAELNIQGIYDTVGDKIREIFNSADVAISIFDMQERLQYYPYLYETGERIRLEPLPVSDAGISAHVRRTRETLVINEDIERVSEQYGSYLLPGTKAEKSAVYVPLIVGDQARGVVSLSNFEHENAFSASDVRLLQTLANSMSVALENARLFEETRRLLEETEQRNRELAIINRVGQALVGQLDPQGIYDLVGEELSQTFDAQAVMIITYDRQSGLFHWPYAIEKGQRQSIPPRTPVGFSGHILHTRQPLLITHDLEQKAVELGSTVVAGQFPKSYLGVPLIAGGEVTGIISLQNIDREEVFSEHDLHLLSTLALNMGVALDNARLYQETQRRAVEMAALAEIGSDIASTHQMEPVLERLAARTRELLKVRDIALYLLQPDGLTLQAIVALGKYTEETKSHTVVLGKSITGYVAQSGVAEIINFPEKDPRAMHISGTPDMEEELECIMIAPLISHGKVIGVMSVYRDRDQGLFTQLELDFLVSLARQAAIAIDSARLYAETSRRATEMAALAEVSREISATLELPVVLDRIARQARELLAAGTSAVYMLQPDGRTLKAIVAHGEVAEAILADDAELGRGIVGNIVQNGAAERISDTIKDPRGEHIPGTSETPEGEKLIVAPLLVQEKAIGALAVWRNPQDPPFDGSELSFSIGLAQQAAVVIENARLYEAAQESQQRMADIIDFLPDPTLVVDREGRVIAWNRAIEELSGVKAVDILGKGDYEYALPFYGERRPILIDLVLLQDKEYEQQYAQIERHGEILVGEALVPDLQGKQAFLFATASALRNSKGEVVGAIETIRDISDRKRAEQELQQAKAEAEAANQAKSAFLAMMSHEIRTPMNAIIGMSGLLMDTPLTPDQRDFAETIRKSGDSLLTIINDILDFSKVEAGKMTLEEQPFDLRECLEVSLDLMKVRAAEKGLELAYQMDPGVPPALLGDVTRLRQVLINLMSNAVKFTEQGEIVLTVANGPEPNSLHFSVRDTGIGISADRIERLFQPFTQADASTSRRYGGTGLGLALSKRLVELMGGSLWVESEGVLGKGSTFHFTITAQPAPDWQGLPQLQGEQPQLRGRRLLIVDDNATNRRILALQTQAWGMLARGAATPGEALEWLRRGDPFDLAILDMQMPEMDGVELAGEIRKLEAERAPVSHLPLVLFTSLGGREVARESTEFVAVLLKPLRQSALFDVLMTIFSGQPIPAARPAPERAALDPTMATRHPLRILLAEDNVVNQKLALRLLSQMGYRADLAANGLEVLQAVKRQPYDVILMDVQMPEMDGLEATRRLCAELDESRRPRIIAMTANAMQGDREMCLAAGMQDYLSKPIRVEELVRALEESLPLSNQQKT